MWHPTPWRSRGALRGRWLQPGKRGTETWHQRPGHCSPLGCRLPTCPPPTRPVCRRSGDGSRITSPDRRSRRPTSASRAGPHPAPRSLSLADAAADLDARIEAAAAGAGALAPELADTSGGHCTGRSAADARAPPRSTLDLRPATSMPQPLGRISAAPGAPISPDPTAPPPLRRVSSQPRAMGLSSESSLHGSSAATGSAVAGSSDFEARGGSHLGGRGGGSSHGGHSDSGRERRSGMPMAAAPAADAMPAAPKAFWHPAVSTPPGSGTAGPQGQASSQQQQREQQAPAAATPTSVCLRAAAAALAPLPQGPSPRSLVQALAAEGDDEGDACTPEVSGADAAARGLSTGSGSVSLLTFQLRGSGASSMAPSREASIRAGATRSREASTRSRPGGLSLALSRESSVKAGQKPGGSGAGSAGPGASPHERSVSCGRRSYSGLTLADAYSDAVLAQHAGGCGSGDWLGAPMPQRLAEMVSERCTWLAGLLGDSRAVCPSSPHSLASSLPAPSLRPQLDACDPSMQQGAAHVDPFAQPAAPRRSVSRRASRRPSCRTSEAIPEEERDALLLELHAPAQVRAAEAFGWEEPAGVTRPRAECSHHSRGGALPCPVSPCSVCPLGAPQLLLPSSALAPRPCRWAPGRSA